MRYSSICVRACDYCGILHTVYRGLASRVLFWARMFSLVLALRRLALVAGRTLRSYLTRGRRQGHLIFLGSKTEKATEFWNSQTLVAAKHMIPALPIARRGPCTCSLAMLAFARAAVWLVARSTSARRTNPAERPHGPRVAAAPRRCRLRAVNWEWTGGDCETHAMPSAAARCLPRMPRTLPRTRVGAPDDAYSPSRKARPSEARGSPVNNDAVTGRRGEHCEQLRGAV